MGVEVRVRGTAKLAAEIGLLKGRLPRVVKQAARDAAKPVLRDTKAMVPIGPAKGGHAKSSLRIVTSRGGIAIRGGGGRFPYYPWLEFGGGVGRNKRTFRQRAPGGRYLFPALRANRANIEKAMNRNIVRAARDSGFKVRSR